MTTISGPLKGVRVIDLTQFALGPCATQTLDDLAAPTANRLAEAGTDEA